MRTDRPRRIPRPFELHWGKGQIVEEATFEGQFHQPSIQLLEFEDGSLSVRFCYYNPEGRFQRSPLMIDAEDIPAFGEALSENTRLRSLLQELVR